MTRGIFCFRNDLRLHDNAALQLALQKCDQLFLVYAFEDRYWLSKNPTRISIHRAKFILQSLEAFTKTDLRAWRHFAFHSWQPRGRPT